MSCMSLRLYASIKKKVFFWKSVFALYVIRITFAKSIKFTGRCELHTILPKRNVMWIT